MSIKKPPTGRRGTAGKSDPEWYKDAIIYEVRVRSFYDKNGDGIGDFAGLAEKLDYLEDLGVTAVWLLPFYPSPLRDDGYDISDYTDVHTHVGTLADFKHFLKEAHRRGLRVITELVLNHTSDQHPWFQRARRAPPGSPQRDFYVWSDTAERYRDARIIFKDFETSNWTWDPVAKAYFWHRFYAHQPDLNFENPQVQKALLGVVDFWLNLGVDGLRLDAVPYLYEEEGTDCENLPATHAFLKKLRHHIDENFDGRMLLAEANQWPEDAVAYFGEGDECHMAFHFPIMPRLFMAIHMEDRFPIADILAQTPSIPSSCQWALFLRNHDELTLEMVTDEERDYMYRAYAGDPAMRINLGIRRRLAPLVGSDRRNVELMNALLFSLPGTPVLYYGDEIGMGDNVYLGDRNGVRTPMQWSADRNAGFSRANPQGLILPVVIDPEYHYESINVEAQQNNPSSLLWWTKRLIALRKRYRAFGFGSIEFLNPDNSRILAFIREFEQETILVVANLSRFVQYARLDLSKYKGLVPTELFGRTRFPAVEEHPYLVTLSGHGFYWFSLERPRTSEIDARVAAYQPPTFDAGEDWEPTLHDDERTRLEELVPAWLESRRWFDAGGRRLTGARIVEAVPMGGEGQTFDLLVVQAEFATGAPVRYLLPLALAAGERADTIRRDAPHAIVANVRVQSADTAYGVLYDAIVDPRSCRTLLEAILRRRRWRLVSGEVGGVVSRRPERDDFSGVEVRILSTDTATPTVAFGNDLVVKLLRRLDDGTSPDLEVGRFLNDHAQPGLAAPIIGHLEYRVGRSEACTLAVVKGFVPNEGDLWRYTRAELGRYYERVLTRPRDERPPIRFAGSPLKLAHEEPPQAVRDVIGAYLDLARHLGVRTAELHAALAGEGDDPAFKLEPHSAMDQRSAYQSLRNLCGSVLRSLRGHLDHLDPETRALADKVLAAEPKLLARFEMVLDTKVTSLRMRCHGNYHLKQVLFTGRDLVQLDFDGERGRSLSSRRRKRSPLFDLASMLRSFHFAATLSLLDRTTVRESDREATEPWAALWVAWTGAHFLRGYRETAGAAPFLPRDESELLIWLDCFMLERALLEVGTEIATPAGRAEIPLRGLIELIETS